MDNRVLILKTRGGYKRYILGKNTKPLTIVMDRLFRCDDRLMIRNNEGGDALIIYDIDSTQPYGAGVLVDTNETMSFIRIARMERSTQSVSFIGGLNQMNPKILLYLLVGGLVVFSLLSGGIF